MFGFLSEDAKTFHKVKGYGVTIPILPMMETKAHKVHYLD